MTVIEHGQHSSFNAAPGGALKKPASLPSSSASSSSPSSSAQYLAAGSIGLVSATAAAAVSFSPFLDSPPSSDDVSHVNAAAVSSSVTRKISFSSSLSPVPHGGSASPIIDEDQLAKTFEEIVACINLDEDEEEPGLGFNAGGYTQGSSHNHVASFMGTDPLSLSNFSRTAFHHAHHRLPTDFTSFFGSADGAGDDSGDANGTGNGPLAQAASLPFSVAVGSEVRLGGAGYVSVEDSADESSVYESARQSAVGPIGSGKPSGSFVGFGRSFLDDDWLSSRVNGSSSALPSGNEGGNVRALSSAQAVHSAATPYPMHAGHSVIRSCPPGDYVCKLCGCAGHWLKDCRLFEPRTPPPSHVSSGGKSFRSLPGSLSASSSSSASSVSSSSMASSMHRTPLPPGNYVCRLCGVAGHWIDQCAKFQPKQHSAMAGGSMMGMSCIGMPHMGMSHVGMTAAAASSASGTSSSSNASPSLASALPPMFGPGPTPNYRPPAYLSKPVPANYICNLCHRPGHWIQQCSEFTPIINGRRIM